MIKERSGGRILVDALCSHGTSHVFCVPGESYLPVLDALLDTQSIRTIVCRQEGGAAMMADAADQTLLITRIGDNDDLSLIQI